MRHIFNSHASFFFHRSAKELKQLVPFGPMDKLNPYLARRAEENTAIAGQITRELIRLQKELKRRMTLANER